jgi:hypothetical protein
MTLPLDKEIWAVAASVISRYQHKAKAYAKRRAKEALNEDDIIKHGLWTAVGMAIEELTRPAEDEQEVN